MAQNYKPCLFQKLAGNTTVKDSMEWGIYIKQIPFKLYPDMKDLPSRDWMDEHGDNEYVPDTPYYKSYEMECEFVYVGTYGTANAKIRDFLKYLAEGGKFKIYDTYTKIGRTDVRYVSYSEDVLYRREGQEDVVVFKVKLKVNNPITDITLTR